MRWVLAVLAVIALVWYWLFFGSSFHCPECGIELPRDPAYPGQRTSRCPGCGWQAD